MGNPPPSIPSIPGIPYWPPRTPAGTPVPPPVQPTLPSQGPYWQPDMRHVEQELRTYHDYHAGRATMGGSGNQYPGVGGHGGYGPTPTGRDPGASGRGHPQPILVLRRGQANVGGGGTNTTGPGFDPRQGQSGSQTVGLPGRGPIEGPTTGPWVAPRPSSATSPRYEPYGRGGRSGPRTPRTEAPGRIPSYGPGVQVQHPEVGGRQPPAASQGSGDDGEQIGRGKCPILLNPTIRVSLVPVQEPDALLPLHLPQNMLS